jgi:uncharacterized protein
MAIVAALIVGMVFGAGLTVAQMVDPRKVLDFLDVASIPKGGWDPTLLMVFAGALLTMYLGYRMQGRMSRPILAHRFPNPSSWPLDVRLISGSVLFGIGWGLAGVCPGPALTALALAGNQISSVLLFVGAMCAGVVLSWAFAPKSDVTVAPATEPRRG